MNKQYKISEIAKMFNITRTALIHYDKWGILSPSIRNEKKYRFYTSEDIQKLELILALKESGLSLKEIQAYMTKVIDKTSVELLIQQKDEIKNKIQTLQIQQDVIERRITILNQFNTITLYDGILVNEYPGFSMIYEPIGHGPLMSYEAAKIRLKNKLNLYGQLSSKFGIMFDITQADQNGKYRMIHVFDYLTETDLGQNMLDIPSQTYLRCLHRGNHTSVEDTINKIKSYAKTKGYDCMMEAHFVPLFDYWESMSQDFIGEVLIPIETHQ